MTLHAEAAMRERCRPWGMQGDLNNFSSQSKGSLAVIVDETTDNWFSHRQVNDWIFSDKTGKMLQVALGENNSDNQLFRIKFANEWIEVFQPTFDVSSETWYITKVVYL